MTRTPTSRIRGAALILSVLLLVAGCTVETYSARPYVYRTTYAPGYTYVYTPDYGYVYVRPAPVVVRPTPVYRTGPRVVVHPGPGRGPRYGYHGGGHGEGHGRGHGHGHGH